MTNFIEEFYYGNIDPQARSSEQNKKVQRDMQTLNESEDFLTDKRAGEESVSVRKSSLSFSVCISRCTFSQKHQIL